MKTFIVACVTAVVLAVIGDGGGIGDRVVIGNRAGGGALRDNDVGKGIVELCGEGEGHGLARSERADIPCDGPRVEIDHAAIARLVARDRVIPYDVYDVADAGDVQGTLILTDEA